MPKHDYFSGLHETSLNGLWNLSNGDYFRVQYYPGVGLFYLIINDKAEAQTTLSEAQLKKLLRKHGAARPD